MIDTPEGREHFNLFYILKEDKERLSLSAEKVEQMRKKIFARTAESYPMQ